MLEGQHHALLRSRRLRLPSNFGRLRSNAQQLPMLGKSTLRGIENHIFLMNFGGSRAGGKRSDALQSAMKRGHVADLQLDFSLSCHWVSRARRRLLSPTADFR